MLFSDGVDRYSTKSSSDVLERARRSMRSCIQLRSAAHARRCSPELAVLTGGRSFLLRDIKDLEKTLADIARELRYQYLLGYAPADSIKTDAREWRSIRVVVKRPGLRVRARDGAVRRSSHPNVAPRRALAVRRRGVCRECRQGAS